MMTKIIMVFMMISVATVRKNHKNHNNLGNYGQKTTNSEMTNRFYTKCFSAW